MNGFHVKINGTPHEVDVDGDTPLLCVLRDVLGMTGIKFGCGQALCGACTVRLDVRGPRCRQHHAGAVCRVVCTHTIPHAYRMHVKAEFPISPASSDPEVSNGSAEYAAASTSIEVIAPSRRAARGQQGRPP